ncbi:MmcQ/YjbR family DNA-binding protein [Limnobaculum xujianqingii]|uniref:MmcQ/YjbR family DNA-binding protein n=1 Tax=Limnobaculum xujianqingii TaxID=2738837 RepID=UPI001E476632|nr:MmcQ/YjbR family DNA-binding protein [Limnobaculum xujianqingii]
MPKYSDKESLDTVTGQGGKQQMKSIIDIFGRRKVDIQKLLAYGFNQHDNRYVYLTDLIEGQFEMTVVVSSQGVVSTTVIDTSTGEDYVLHHVVATTGAFVGKLREEYERVLTDIAKVCFIPDVFKSPVTRQVIQFIRDKYHDELEFLWPRTPDNAIFRRQDNAKWYGAILTIKNNKLGLDGEERIEILDLRMDPDDIIALTDGKKYFPGFHMNKKYWITIRLDGSVSVDEIFMRIDNSFKLAVK